MRSAMSSHTRSIRSRVPAAEAESTPSSELAIGIPPALAPDPPVGPPQDVSRLTQNLAGVAHEDGHRHATAGLPGGENVDQLQVRLLNVLDTSAIKRPPRLLADVIEGWREAGLTVRTIRGRKMGTVDGLFDEVAAALQFPHYFGVNWPAFDECLADMDWLAMNVGIVVLILEAEHVLADTADVEPSALVRTILHAAVTKPARGSVRVFGLIEKRQPPEVESSASGVRRRFGRETASRPSPRAVTGRFWACADPSAYGTGPAFAKAGVTSKAWMLVA
jgi:hypothetical protein